VCVSAAQHEHVAAGCQAWSALQTPSIAHELFQLMKLIIQHPSHHQTRRCCTLWKGLPIGSHMSQHLAPAALLLTTWDKVFAIGMTGLATCAAIESSVGCLELVKAGQKAANLPPLVEPSPFRPSGCFLYGAHGWPE
jgi:hypothetical protein